MKATIRDAQILAALRPLELAAYLRSTGWREAKVIPDRWTTWVKGEDFEVALPLNREFADFAQRMGDALRTLEAAEERSQLDILSDLLTTSADVLRLRITDGDAADGSIPIEEGAQVASKARDLIMAAACATIERRSYFQTRKPNQAVEYLRKVRMGQTERGSYVLTIISRVAPMLDAPADGQLMELEQPYERRVMETLAHAAAAVKQAAERSAAKGNFEDFQASVSQGVSANLCDAIVGLGGGGEMQRGLEVGFTWSRTRPSLADLPRTIALSGDVMPVIQEAGRVFREKAAREEFELRGPVVRLDRPEGQPMGTVTIFGLIDDQPRKVAVELAEADYHRAVQAHDNQQTILCYGTLQRDGRSFVLKNPAGLEIETEE